ncbi:MAG: AmmeMemoRadiSam system protein B, partial [Nitrosarchaeum sp.]|nr:AmmeMemoRadiSam system protein B [Nitrosarchaeum sp.]
ARLTDGRHRKPPTREKPRRLCITTAPINTFNYSQAFRTITYRLDIACTATQTHLSTTRHENTCTQDVHLCGNYWTPSTQQIWTDDARAESSGVSEIRCASPYGLATTTPSEKKPATKKRKQNPQSRQDLPRHTSAPGRKGIRREETATPAMREALYAGHLYPKTELALKRALTEAFEHARGPGSIPPRTPQKEAIRGLLAPYSALSIAGPCAAWSYTALAQAPDPDLYIIAATNLTELHSALGLRTYAMPFGEVRVDQRFAQDLSAKGTIPIVDTFHEQDPAIEVQLPWIQFVTRPNIKVLPLLLADDIDLKTLAVDIKETLAEHNKTAQLILSAEMTHHGPAYTFMPFNKPALPHIYANDKKALERLTALDLQGYLNICKQGPCSSDAIFPIELAFHLLKPKKITLEHYYTSADITGEEKNIAAYVSLLFY